MDHNIKPYVVHEELVEDHRADGLRSGEGCIAPLGNGELYMVYGSFDGPRDEDRAALIERRSEDGGIHWTEREVLLRPPEGALNVMSASLLPLNDGRLAALYLQKNSREDCFPLFMASDDDARTWSAPVRTTERPGYYVVNNDRLAQLSTGRLLVPYAWTDRSIDHAWNVFCGCAVSDDLGRTWRLGEQEIRIESENVVLPKLVDESRPEALCDVSEGRAACQEPGVIELLDGRVFMWCRSPGGYAYRAQSDDGGETWAPFKAIREFAMPCGPQTVKRLPDSERLIMLYNDREGIPYGHPQFQWRRPLTVAASDDDGETWRRHGLLEPDTVPSNCYYSLCFHNGNAVFTYYEGVMHTAAGGAFVPRNLASLKLKIVRQEYFDL